MRDAVTELVDPLPVIAPGEVFFFRTGTIEGRDYDYRGRTPSHLHDCWH